MELAQIVEIAESSVAAALWTVVVKGNDVIDLSELGTTSATGHGAVHPLGGERLSNAVGDRVAGCLCIEWRTGCWVREDPGPCRCISGEPARHVGWKGRAVWKHAGQIACICIGPLLTSGVGRRGLCRHCRRGCLCSFCGRGFCCTRCVVGGSQELAEQREHGNGDRRPRLVGEPILVGRQVEENLVVDFAL